MHRELKLTYRLKGPLAQFGRPAIVDGLVDGLLARFAANLAAATSGRRADTRPMGLGAGAEGIAAPAVFRRAMHFAQSR